MKIKLSHSLAAALWQGPLLVLIAALIGITVNALRPGGLTLSRTAAPVMAEPTDAGRGMLPEAATAPVEKDAAVIADTRGPAADGPSVQVPEYRFEFDPVPEGVDVEHAFIVRNRGAQVLRIDRVKPG